MIHRELAGLMLAVASPPSPDSIAQIQLAQFTVRETIIVRVPRTSAPPPVVRYKEKSAPKCVSVAQIAGAAFMGPKTVDFIAQGGTRIRASLESSCPALGFYGGFYLMPGRDQTLCVNRDAIHTRSGTKCTIKRFRRLIPIKERVSP